MEWFRLTDGSLRSRATNVKLSTCRSIAATESGSPASFLHDSGIYGLRIEAAEDLLDEGARLFDETGRTGNRRARLLLTAQASCCIYLFESVIALSSTRRWTLTGSQPTQTSRPYELTSTSAPSNSENAVCDSPSSPQHSQ